MRIGITGPSGAGKTSISKLLKEKLDADIINADEIVKEMSVSGTEYFKEIVKTFGENILLDNGEINKPKLANIIFSDASQRELLNSITFKYIVDEIKTKHVDFASVSDWAQEAIIWALANGVISGQGGKYIDPQGSAQRCQVAQIMYNIFTKNIF